MSKFSELNDTFHALVNFFFSQPQNRSVDVDVFAPRQHRVEPSTQFDHRPHVSVDRNSARVGEDQPVDHFEHGAFSSPVWSEHPHALASANLEIGVFDREEFSRPQIL